MQIGIDLGGTKIEIIAMDDQSNTLLRQRIASPQDDYQKTLQSIYELLNSTEQSLEQKGSVGIGIPGSLSRESGRVKNANSTWLIGKPFKQDLEALLDRPISIANDADCFILSEVRDGAAKGFNNAFGIILGTGVGGGFVINGELLQGPNSISGEWGHNPLPWPTKSDIAMPCYCGKSGCIETYLSGPGLAQQYTQHLPVQNQTKISAEKVIQKLHEGDTHAATQFRLYRNQLSRALASVINIVDPEIIVFGGGLSNIDELYFGLEEEILEFIFSNTLNTQFVKAKHGDSSGVRGAACLGAAHSTHTHTQAGTYMDTQY